MERQAIQSTVTDVMSSQRITDMHTHCYPPSFGASPAPEGLLLWGIDELVTYHYLIAEVYRVVPATQLPYEKFWQMTKVQQADHIWMHLFVERTPISEACRGVLTTLTLLGLDPNAKSLAPSRQWFAEQDPDDYIDKVMQIANVDSMTMTNPVFDDLEREKWLANPAIGDDPRFEAVLRIDPLLSQWPAAMARLTEWGYQVAEDFSGSTRDELGRFLRDWIERMKPIYIAASLPPTFRYPDPTTPAVNQFIEECLMPVCADGGLPWALMIGSLRGANPALADAGDMVGKADVLNVVNLCNKFPKNRFLVTMLSLENQHELCVTARKFSNLMVFGCWWFLNNPSLVDRITRQRLELLGTSFVPQHSDARVLDQILYKWHHSRASIARVLVDKYEDLAAAGLRITPEQIRRDVALLLRENFRTFIGR